MAAVMTYGSLKNDLTVYCERPNDQNFQAQLDRFIMNAENRIASEARGLGFIQSATDNLGTGVNAQALTKPNRWRENASINIGIGTGFNRRFTLKMRNYEYVRKVYPDPTALGQPVYYADWDWAHLLIAPSPDLAYPYEWLYFERPVPLDASNTTNWTTQYAPQLILMACLLEASAYVKNADMIKTWQEQYDRALKQVEFESRRRLAARSQTNPNPA